MIDEIVAGLVVLVVGSIGGWAIQSRLIQRMFIDSEWWRFVGTLSHRHGNAKFGEIETLLINRLLQDQSKAGPQRGQFGNSTATATSEKIYNRNREAMEAKPRMHATRWPCLVLHRHELAIPQVAIAINAVRSLFEDGVIKGKNPFPPNSLPGQEPKPLTNFRHTMCGALVLLEFEGPNPITGRILAKMLDDGAHWQNQDGGWSDISTYLGQSDIFASSYAAQILFKSLEVDMFSTEVETETITALSRTIAFMKEAWLADGWKFGELNSEEIFPQIVAELSHVLKVHDPEWLQSLEKLASEQLNRAGDVRRGYAEKCHPTVDEARLRARLTYCAFLAGDFQPDLAWTGATWTAEEINRLTAVELAQILDIRLALSKGSNLKVVS